jgi:hypothetical protein
MQHEAVSQMFKRYHEHKAKGIKHTPLHTLKECCEEAGIYPSLFGRYAAQHPNPPQPVLRHAKNVGRGAVKYYRKHEFVQWVNQVRQQKEKAMPDIKTALQEALSKTATAWAEDDEAHHKMEPKTEQAMPENNPAKEHFAVTNNVCRATFDCIKHNPGSTRKEIIDALSSQGYKAASTATLIGQMLQAIPRARLKGVAVRHQRSIRATQRLQGMGQDTSSKGSTAQARGACQQAHRRDHQPTTCASACPCAYARGERVDA